MNYQEFQKIKTYKYEDYVKYLKEKYGIVPEDYCSKSFTPNMNIKRKQSDNLYIHHIREDKVANLSDMSIAATAPFEYQQAHNLVYCNLLEHILLHIMIGEQNQGLGFGGAQLMIMQANDCYPNGNEVLEELKTRCENSLAAYEILLEHNMTLFYDLDETLMTSDRALVVLGTGLGKTTTGLAYLRKYGYKAIVLCPNNTIVLGWKDNPEVTAITYQKFMNSYMKEDYSKYQVLICDEAHHCTAARWGEGIRYVLDNGLLKVIGLTATPKAKKDKKNFETTAEFFNHKVCQGYTVLDGIENGKIHDFSYVGAIYDTSGLREKYANIDDKTLLGELDLELNNTPTMDEILTKHMPTSKRKGIIFVSSIEAMEEAESIMRNLYPNMEYRRLHSLLPNADVEDTRNWFQNTDEGYLLAVNMISEGAHYKGVNTLIMFRRTQSSLVFNQQLGRIITLVRDEDPEAIVFDLVNNANLIENAGDRFATSLRKAYKARKEKDGKEKSNQIIIADYTEKISEVLEKIRGAWNNNKRAIYCYETKQIFSSITEAALSLGIDMRLISGCCRGITKTACGYHWCYLDDKDNFIPQEWDSKISVLCLELNQKFTSTTEAAQYVNKNSSGITACLKGNQKTCGGYHWIYFQELTEAECKHKIIEIEGIRGSKKFAKPVRCIETQEIFDSVSDANKKYNTNHISAVCNGTRKTACGYHWEYVK